MIADTNRIIRTYLATCTTLTALVTTPAPASFLQIYCPRLPEKLDLSVKPAISFFTRGGTSTPYIPGIPEPSVQFDCWADDPIQARRVYRALYDSLQGIQNVSVAVPARVIGTDGNDYDCILAHLATNRNKPITGAQTAIYWADTGDSGLGVVWVAGTLYRLTCEIMSAIEEVQGQDLVDVDIPNYFRVLTFFRVMIRAE